jgi:hypothetical protein
VTLPKPGDYRILSDFLPTGGSPQFIGRTLETVDFTAISNRKHRISRPTST